MSSPRNNNNNSKKTAPNPIDVEAELLAHIAELEAEAEAKQRAAEKAIRNARSALQKVEPQTTARKKSNDNDGSVGVIAQIIAVAEKEAKAPTTNNETTREDVVVVKKEVHRVPLKTAAESPARKKTMPPRPKPDPEADVPNDFEYGTTLEVSVCSDHYRGNDNNCNYDGIQMAMSDLSMEDSTDVIRSEKQVKETVGGALDDIMARIEECTRVLRDPNASQDEKVAAAKLANQYANTARALENAM